MGVTEGGGEGRCVGISGGVGNGFGVMLEGRGEEQESAGKRETVGCSTETSPAYFVLFYPLHFPFSCPLQGWLLLAITIPFFLPMKPKFLWYLEQHIQEHIHSRFVGALNTAL